MFHFLFGCDEAHSRVDCDRESLRAIILIMSHSKTLFAVILIMFGFFHLGIAKEKKCEQIFLNISDAFFEKYRWSTTTQIWGPEKVKFLPPEKVRNENKQYPKDLKKIGEKLARKTQLARSPKVVLYPMSGYDGAAPFLAFPSVTTVIGIDNHALVGETEPALNIKTATLPITPQISGQAWASTLNDVNGENNMAIPVLQTLSKGIPGFRFRQMTVNKNKIRGEFRRDTLVDGIIEFDTGDNTPVRRYIHLNRDLQEMGSPANQAKLSSLLADAPLDMILLKGSNNAVDARKEEVDNDGPNHFKLSRDFLKELIRVTSRERPLLLIEGESVRKRQSGPEFSGWDNAFPKATRQGKVSVGDEKFSYGSNVYFHEFGN